MKKLFFLLSTLFVFCLSCKKHDAEIQDELKYQTDFSIDDHSWFTDANHTFTKTGTNWVYRTSQSQPNLQTWGIAPYSTINYNYSVSADALLYDGSYNGMVGLVFNFIDENHYYAFYIRSNQTFFVFKKDDSGFTTLINTTPSPYIITGNKVNHLEVRQTGSTAFFLANYTTVGNCASNANGMVSVGTALQTAPSPYFNPLTADFDNFTIKKIK